jgi:hypothetical protein
MAAKEVELEAKGYTSGIARAAVSRARGAAEKMTAVVRPEIQPMAFLDILRSELAAADEWAARTHSQSEASTAETSPAREGGV